MCVSRAPNQDINAYRDALTFEAWTLFHQAFPAQVQLSHHFRVSREQVEMEWDSIVANLSKLDNPCVRTFFCGLGMSLDLSQLLSLTNISSLAALSLVPAPRYGHIHESDILADYNRLRNWCRAASEKKTLLNLKMLYLGATSKDAAQDTVLLDYLSALPALTLVGFKRSQLDMSGAKTYGPWKWVKEDSDRYTQILKGYDETEHRSMAERVLHLYNITKDSPLPTSGVWVQPGGSLGELLKGKGGREVRLSMTCFTVLSSRLDDVVWYRRNNLSPSFCSKRLQEFQTTTTTDGAKKGPKKRKMRQNKQQDVGLLLGEFL
jgi:hypothetical protein